MGEGNVIDNKKRGIDDKGILSPLAVEKKSTLPKSLPLPNNCPEYNSDVALYGIKFAINNVMKVDLSSYRMHEHDRVLTQFAVLEPNIKTLEKALKSKGFRITHIKHTLFNPYADSEMVKHFKKDEKKDNIDATLHIRLYKIIGITLTPPVKSDDTGFLLACHWESKRGGFSSIKHMGESRKNKKSNKSANYYVGGEFMVPILTELFGDKFFLIFK